MAIYKPSRDASEETDPADTLTPGLQPPELCEIKPLAPGCGPLSGQPKQTDASPSIMQAGQSWGQGCSRE